MAGFERDYKILEYLRKNTDVNNTTSRLMMEKDPEISKYLGKHKSTFNSLIRDMALTLNGEKEDSWRIIYDDYIRQFRDFKVLNGIHIKNLYYNHTFSYDEIDSLIEGILFSKTLDDKSKRQLISKIEENLTSKHYKEKSRGICTVYEPQFIDNKQLRKNLQTLSQAIADEVQIDFDFYGYNKKKELEKVGTFIGTSPYYVVANTGKYYLLACNGKKYNGKYHISIYRVDLMRNVSIRNRNEELEIIGIPAIEKREVSDLPLRWDETFQLQHLYMSYDKPVDITLKVSRMQNKWNNAGYTFLYDYFGSNFKCIKENGDYAIVKVKASPFGMINWALQYSDRVEILEPLSVREQVINKIKNLNIKYEV